MHLHASSICIVPKTMGMKYVHTVAFTMQDSYPFVNFGVGCYILNKIPQGTANYCLFFSVVQSQEKPSVNKPFVC